jgi:hypothetical protein
MLKNLACVLLAAAVVMPACAQMADRQSRAVNIGASAAPATPATLKLLNQRIPETTFSEAPFEQVMDWLAELTQVNVIVRWQKLEDAGIPRDKPVTIKAKNLHLSQVLWMIMNEAGGSDVKLAYRATGNMIVLSTEEDLGQEMVVRVYDVSDLLVNVPTFTNAARLDPGQALNQLGQGGGTGGGGGGSSQLFETGQGNNQNQQQNAQGLGMDQLIKLITDVIEPNSWTQNGGTGTIQPFGNHLIVRNNILVHQQLGGYVQED